jgi:putative transposase
MVTTEQRRRVVTFLRAAYPVSTRRALRLVGLSRSRWHYRPQRPRRDAPIRERLKEVTKLRPRFGYKRLAVLLRRECHVVKLKRVYPLYREERPMVRRHRSKHVMAPRVPLPAPTQPNERWGMDFIHDACVGGRRFRCLTMVDEFTRECPRIDADTSLPAVCVIAALEQLAGERGLPKSIVVDHGPEFIGVGEHRHLRCGPQFLQQRELRVEHLRPKPHAGLRQLLEKRPADVDRIHPPAPASESPAPEPAL